MPLCYLALGSNLGDRWANLSAAVRRLRAEPGLRVVATSEYYETAPVDCPPGSGDYLNAVVAVETERSPEAADASTFRKSRTGHRITWNARSDFPKTTRAMAHSA